MQLAYLVEFMREHLIDRNQDDLSSFIIRPPDPIALRHRVLLKHFYLPTLYVWLPFDIDSSFRPFCPTCGHNDVTRKGWSGFRRVLDLETVSYAVTRRYLCKKQSCRRAFLAWDDTIMERAPAHILFTFPIIFTHRLGVTLAVFDLMRSCLDAGTGPGPFASLLEEHHRRRYERCRVAYLTRLSSLQKPQSGQTSMHATELMEEPPVFSTFDDPDGYGGVSISSNYLRKVYTNCMSKLEGHMKRKNAMVPAKVLSGDHFFKILKCNFTFGGSRSFEAAYSLVNEHSEVIAVVLTQSKSLEEIRGMLTGVAKRLVALGLPKDDITLFYTDNPIAEKSFLHSIFDGLRYQAGVEASLPFYSFPADHTVMPSTTSASVNLSMRIFRAELASMAATGKALVVGFDTEWTVSRVMGRSSTNTEVLQLSTATRTLVIQVSRAGLPHELKSLLCDETVLKVGRSISADVKRLQKKWPDLVVANIKDLGAVAKDFGLVTHANVALKTMCEELLRVTLDKTQQVGHWGGDLSDAQITYAAKDAHACWSLYDMMMSSGSRLIKADNLTDNAPVIVMDASGTERVATATISSNQPAPGGRRVAAHKRRVMVNVVTVLVPSYVLPLSRTPEPTTLGTLWHEAEQGGQHASFLVECRHLRNANHPLELRVARERQPRPHLPIDANDGVFDARQEVTLDRGRLQAMVSAGGAAAWDDDEEGASEGEEDDQLGAVEDDDDIAELDVEMADAADWEHSGVKADPMHVMDRILRLLSKKHGAHGLFSRRLSQSMMLSNLKDALAAKAVAAEKWPNTPWAEVLFRRSRWLNRRVRRFIPPPDVLVDRLQAVYTEFRGIVDATTGSPLFTPQADKAFKAVIKLAQSGAVSDHPGVPLYVLLSHDRDELPLWLCFRGTNANEGGVHQKLVKNFMSMKGASPELVSFALLEWVHRSNMRAATRNRGVSFPGHYDTWLVDAVCKLEEDLYGRRIAWPSWQCATDYSLPQFCCGVMPMDSSEMSKLGLPVGEQLQQALTVMEHVSSQKRWLARAMKSELPLLPVHTVDEIKLYHKTHDRLVAAKEKELHKAAAPGEVVILSSADSEPSLEEITVAFNDGVTVAWLEVAKKVAVANENLSKWKEQLAGWRERQARAKKSTAAAPGSASGPEKAPALPRVSVAGPTVYYKTMDHVRMFSTRFERSRNVMNTLVVHNTMLRRDVVAAGESYTRFGLPADAMDAVHPLRAVCAGSGIPGGVGAAAAAGAPAGPASDVRAAAAARVPAGPSGGLGAAAPAWVPAGPAGDVRAAAAARAPAGPGGVGTAAAAGAPAGPAGGVRAAPAAGGDADAGEEEYDEPVGEFGFRPGVDHRSMAWAAPTNRNTSTRGSAATPTPPFPRPAQPHAAYTVPLAPSHSPAVATSQPSIPFVLPAHQGLPGPSLGGFVAPVWPQLFPFPVGATPAPPVPWNPSAAPMMVYSAPVPPPPPLAPFVAPLPAGAGPTSRDTVYTPVARQRRAPRHCATCTLAGCPGARTQQHCPEWQGRHGAAPVLPSSTTGRSPHGDEEPASKARRRR